MIKIKAARLAKGWTQRDLAFYARLSEAEVSKLERGWHKPFPRQAARLAEVLGLRPEELLEEVPENEHGCG
ncbi:MAG: helix-turn-helix domain-containing protein [Betaproteobacteria bacterium]